MPKFRSTIAFMLALSCFLLSGFNMRSVNAEDSFNVTLRSRSETDGKIGLKNEQQDWDSTKTAVIVCDMWDSHHCFNAVQRVGEIGPRMSKVISFARQHGSTIIHAPSSCVDHYTDHPARKHVASVPKAATVPDQIESWCHRIDPESADEYPIDQSDGGEDDDPADHAAWAKKLKSQGLNPRSPWKKQTDLIPIEDADFISDNGVEIWSILQHREIENVILVGVHTNMCVLGRPFGLRQLAKNDMNVVLMRDMTDSMYNPNAWPFVSHFQGTDLIVQHIEQHVCPTITSDQLVGGKPFRFKNDVRQKAVIVIAEKLYNTKETLTAFSNKVIRDQLGFDVQVLHAAEGENEVAGLADALKDAALLIVSARRRALPESDLAAIRTHISAGKPVVAIRTASHAFDTKGKHPEGHAEWTEFDSEVLGADYTGHFANELNTHIALVESAASHPILTGVKPYRSEGSLYKSEIVSDRATLLLNGSVKPPKGGEHAGTTQPIAWTNTIDKQSGGGRVFYTSLGHESDFANSSFNTLLENGVRWATEMKIGPRPKIEMEK